MLMNRLASALKNPIGQRLKQAMAARQMSSAVLAKNADVKTSFIYDVLSGKSANPSPVKLARLAQSLGISVAQLIGNDEPVGQPMAIDGDYVGIPRIKADFSSGSGKIGRLQGSAGILLFPHAMDTAEAACRYR